MREATKMAKADDIVIASNVLLAAVASTFGRVASNMRETSVKLAGASERIKHAVPPPRRLALSR
jgi:hypothetical protein